MKQKLNRFARVFAPLCLSLIIVLISAMPASAVSIYTLDAGGYVFEDNPPEPDVAFMVNMPFTSNDLSYKAMIYRPADPEASFKYAGIYFVNTSGVETRVGYWVNGEFVWIGYFWRIVTLTSSYTPENRTFFWWFYTCTTSRTVADVSDPWGNISQTQEDQLAGMFDQIQTDLNTITDAHSKLPQVNINPDDYAISLWNEPQYLAYVDTLTTVWDSNYMMKIVTLLGALLLCSYLVFAGK